MSPKWRWAPHMTGGLGGCDTNFEFELALDVILDGLERLR
jgi:hypothetical protein